MVHHKAALFLVSVLFFFGCAHPTVPDTSSRLEPSEGCRAFFAHLDKEVARAGAQDASSYPVPGFPYLRTDRFLASLMTTLKNDKDKDQWLELMRQMDLSAREKEVFNLPDSETHREESTQKWPAKRNDLDDRVKVCSATLFMNDRRQPGFFESLYQHSQIPDEYSSLMRIAGLYPLMSIPVAVVSEHAREKIKTRFTKDLKDLPVTGILRTYAPAMHVNLSQAEIEDILATCSNNPLRIPLPEKTQERDLATFFSPLLIQDVAASYDLPGRIVKDEMGFFVDPKTPTIYYYTSHAFLHHRPILQINYVIWYSERAGKNSPWIERGHLDGLTMRVSLDEQGKVFMVDLMNNCGCYHFFIPWKEKVLQVKSVGCSFGPLVPQWLPSLSHADRLAVRVNSGWHQVQRLLAVQSPANPILYELLPYGTLESFPDEGGRHVSLFDANGIAKGSERIEPLLLFSMGIPSIGSMRQRGHHAIELIGQAQFDDPYLFEKNFVFR